MTQDTCLTCKYRVAHLDFDDPNGCLTRDGSRYANNCNGRCAGHTLSLWTWLFKRRLDRRPR